MLPIRGGRRETETASIVAPKVTTALISTHHHSVTPICSRDIHNKNLLCHANSEINIQWRKSMQPSMLPKRGTRADTIQTIMSTTVGTELTCILHPSMFFAITISRMCPWCLKFTHVVMCWFYCRGWVQTHSCRPCKHMQPAIRGGRRETEAASIAVPKVMIAVLFTLQGYIYMVNHLKNIHNNQRVITGNDFVNVNISYPDMNP